MIGRNSGWALGAATCVGAWLGTAGTALPGAWLREEGAWFLSATATLRQTETGRRTETEAYLEYGLRPRLTLGGNLYGVQGQSGHALAFLRLPILPLESETKLAFELGAGAHYTGPEWSPMWKAGVSFGRGFKLAQSYGWLNVEASYEDRLGDPSPLYKVETTIGQSTGGPLRPMMKFTASQIVGQDLTWKASANLLIDGQGATTWIVGVEREEADRPGTALSLGLWRSF